MFVAMKGINLSLKQEAPATFDPSIDALSIHSAMPEPDPGALDPTLWTLHLKTDVLSMHSAMPEPDSGAFNPNPKPYNLNPRSSHPNPRP